ncbi:hypothetical protein Hanom_Chr04g00379311 [Helianthus anomalus]
MLTLVQNRFFVVSKSIFGGVLEYKAPNNKISTLINKHTTKKIASKLYTTIKLIFESEVVNSNT